MWTATFGSTTTLAQFPRGRGGGKLGDKDNDTLGKWIAGVPRQSLALVHASDSAEDLYDVSARHTPHKTSN